MKSEVRKPLGKRRNLHFNEFQSLLIFITGGIGDFIVGVRVYLSSSSVFFESHSISASRKKAGTEKFGITAFQVQGSLC